MSDQVMTDPSGLPEMNPSGRFADRAADYARWRPSYPAGAIDAVLEGLGEASSLVAADVGAGTGISSRLLAARGVRVVAVEPNAVMRREGQSDEATKRRSEGGSQGEIEWRNGTAERTGLGDGSVDLVLCAQAFHWFREPEALNEFARVLKARTPGGAAGRLALMWNDRRPDDAFSAEYSGLMREASDHHAAEKDFDPRPLVREHAGFTDVRLVEVPSFQELDLEGVLGRALSASYAPKEGLLHEALVRGLRTAHARWADGRGKVRLVYVTRVYLAEVGGK